MSIPKRPKLPRQLNGIQKIAFKVVWRREMIRLIHIIAAVYEVIRQSLYRFDW